MKCLTVIQIAAFIVGVIMFLLGVLTALNVIPSGALLLTTGGFHRVADTCILFSIGLGVLVVVKRK